VTEQAYSLTVDQRGRCELAGAAAAPGACNGYMGDAGQEFIRTPSAHLRCFRAPSSAYRLQVSDGVLGAFGEIHTTNGSPVRFGDKFAISKRPSCWWINSSTSGGSIPG
jgi:hypothetical protein